MLRDICRLFRDRIRGRNLKDAKDFFEVLSYIVVVAGVPAYFVQQYQQQGAQQVSNTLEYIRLHQSERVAAARERLALSWFDYAGSLPAINSDGISSEVLDHMVRSMVDASIEKDAKDNLRQSLLVLNDFYNQLAICIESRTCDVESARTYFSSETTQLSKLYGGWFAQTRETLNIPDLGLGIETFKNLPQPSSWLEKVL